MKNLTVFLLSGWWLLDVTADTSAQDLLTNMQIFETLGVTCMEFVPAEVDSLVLSPARTMPYVTSALLHRWKRQGKILFSSDSLQTSDSRHQVSWDVSKAKISYARVRRKILSRSAELNLRYTLLGPDGEFLAHDHCLETFSDEIPEYMVPDLESIVYPETQAKLPPAHWTVRYLEPVIIVAATGLAAFLFFNLRNQSADS